MRRLPAALLVSMASHATALGWVVCSSNVLAVPLHGRPVAPIPPPRPDAAAASEPLAVVLLDLPPTPASAPAPVPAPVPVTTAPAARDRAPERSIAAATSADRAGRPPPGGPAISIGAPRGPERTQIPAASTAPGDPSGGPGRSRWMTMRGPERPRAGLSSGFLDDFLAHSRPLAPPPDIPGERIADELAEARRQLRHAEHTGSSNAGGLLQQIVALNEQRLAEDLKPSGGGTYQADRRTFTAKVDADGQVHLQDKPSELDIQDQLLLRMGTDPYARNKLALLDRTRDQRAAVGERHRRAQLARSVELMRANIERLWATTGELAARKRGLFELWDDCAETGSAEGVAAGAAARAFVVGAIRGRLRGSAAYTAAELAELNAHRQSTAGFAPYD